MISTPTLIILILIALLGYVAGKKVLPVVLEHDHDAVVRLLAKMDTSYANVVATKSKMDTQRSAILTKLSNAIKPATAPTAPAAPAAPVADAPAKV